MQPGPDLLPVLYYVLLVGFWRVLHDTSAFPKQMRHDEICDVLKNLSKNLEKVTEQINH
jgi:hypothetical protein